MKYKPITDMTDKEIEFLWKDILGKDIKIVTVERKIEENEIEVTIMSKWRNDEEEIETDDLICMYSDDFDGGNYPFNEEDEWKYKQYMIAKGYSEYWKNNKYVD